MLGTINEKALQELGWPRLCAELVLVSAQVTRIFNEQLLEDEQTLKRYLAKQFHPDFAPGQGIEKIVRNEIFKEIWSEIERLDEAVSSARFASTQT